MRQTIELKAILFIVVTLLFSSCKTRLSEKDKMFTISGKVITNKLYCGGAQPTEKMLTELKKPIAYVNKSFYIKPLSNASTNQKTLLKFTSDSLGDFKFQLTSGSYAVFLDEQINQIDFSTVKNLKLNQDCYNTWLTTPYDTIVIKSQNVNEIEYKIQKHCFIDYDIPCLEYIGPKPQ